MPLFLRQNITLHSGQKSDFKIECEALTGEDLDTLAYLISKRFRFKRVIGIIRGGMRLMLALEKYISQDSPEENLPVLIVDDVLTTGGSMEDAKKKLGEPCIGVVIYSRGKCSGWVHPIFQMWDN
jgi:hypothetical protein|tara:strand:+ start:3729 stop:4103 length:375 start_codon:yes stop_codon:yes gene_type:complete